MITKSNITKKKKRVLGLLALGILAIFLIGCTEQADTTSAQASQDNIQSSQFNATLDNKQNLPPDGNFTPGDRPMPPQDGNFTPGDRPIPPQDGNFTPEERPNFPKDANQTPINK